MTTARQLTLPLDDVPLLVDALRTDANRRKRAAMALSAQLSETRRAGRDVRSAAVKVVDTLADAERLTLLADTLEADAADTPADPLAVNLGTDLEDGTTPEAAAAAERAGLAPTILPTGDPDDPTPDELAELDADALIDDTAGRA